MTTLDQASKANRAVQAAEIAFVFLVAFAVVSVGWWIVGDNLLGRQAVVWVANVLMLVTIWIGLRIRGQTWERFGLTFHWRDWGALGRTLLQSVVVLVLALTAFISGSVVMRNVATSTTNADMSGYNYLEGNLPMLLVALAAVYVVSSFGEEVLYRGFLITRLEEFTEAGKAASSIAVVISALVFGLVHFDWGIVGIVQTTFMGLVLGISYVVTKRNLWVLILAHAYMDTLLLVQMYVGTSNAG